MECSRPMYRLDGSALIIHSSMKKNRTLETEGCGTQEKPTCRSLGARNDNNCRKQHTQECLCHGWLDFGERGPENSVLRPALGVSED